MTQSTRDHMAIMRYIKEAIESCKEAYKEAVEFDAPNARARMEKVLSELFDLDFDMRTYCAVMADQPTSDYDSLMQIVQEKKASEGFLFASEKQKMMAEIFADAQAADDEVTYQGGDAGIICPLTAKVPEKPVVSRVCHHVFEESAIREFMTVNGQGVNRVIECPKAGCNARFGLRDLYTDAAISRQVADARREVDDNWDTL